MINPKILSKVWDLIPASQKKRTPLLVVLIFCGMLFEVFGLGVLFPIVIGLLDANKIRGFINQNLEIIVPYTENLADISLILLGLLGLVMLYIIKSGFLIFLSFMQNDYLTKVVRDNSNQLFISYFCQDYIYFTKKNSSEIIKRFQLEFNYLMSYLSSLSYVITEFCMSLAIILTLIIIEPIGASIVALFFGGISILFFSFFRNKIASYGEQQELIDRKMAKNILESFQSVKEIILKNKFAYFNKIHQNSNVIKTNAMRYQLTIGQVPRLFLELVAVFGLSIFIMALLWQGFDTTKLVSILTIFVAASFRLIPSLNRLIGGLQNMKYMQATVEVLHKEYKSIYSEKNDMINVHELIIPKTQIRLKDISFSYADKDKVLENVNIVIPVGHTIGVIGGSGEGKTTFLDVMIGLLAPQKGCFFIDDQKITSKNIAQWQSNIGYVSQLITLTDDTIRKNIAFGIDEEQIDDNMLSICIEKAQLKEFIETQEKGVETVVGERGIQLSGGQRQRIGIARALYHDPEVLVFDEATSALDESTEANFMSSIEQFKGEKTIIIVTHRLSTLRFCDAIYELKKTKLKPYKKENELY